MTNLLGQLPPHYFPPGSGLRAAELAARPAQEQLTAKGYHVLIHHPTNPTVFHSPHSPLQRKKWGSEWDQPLNPSRRHRLPPNILKMGFAASIAHAKTKKIKIK